MPTARMLTQNRNGVLVPQTASCSSSAIAIEAEAIAWKAFSYYPPLNRARAYVIQHLHDNISLSDVARAACLEKTYFSAYFRKKVGIPFTAWLRIIRIARAMQLLHENDTPVSNVSRRVGFSSVRSFERSFRILIGETPRSFKQRVTREFPTFSQVVAQSTQIMAHLSQDSVL